jgi:mannose-6-phosphate isomerase
VKPIALGPNTLTSFYSGVGRIGAFRRNPDVPASHAEDWIASTITRFGTASSGLTHLPDGSALADRFAEDPVSWFGSEHTERYGARGALLVKLLDAGNRLPLHVHPDRPFAREHLDSDFGKSEAWLVLHADPAATAHFGFARDVSRQELDEWVSRQDTTTLLGACNEVRLRSGDVVFCPGGVPHAIGAGVLILEIQEMTDFSIMLEWAGFPLNADDLFLHLDQKTALGAVNRRGIVGDELTALLGHCLRPLAGSADPGVTSLLPASADHLFAAEQVVIRDGAVDLDQRFSVLVINEGDGTVTHADEPSARVTAGDVYLVPYDSGPVRLDGTLSALRCSPR